MITSTSQSAPGNDRLARPRLLAPRLHSCPGWAAWLLGALVFAGTFAFRLLAPELKNDHFWWISAGRQILTYGELPFRDFWEPGYFLQCLTSAFVQLLFGYNLLGEVLVSILFIALGTALTFCLAVRASGSLIIGLLSASFVVATYPRLYHYPKIFFYVFALLLLWQYIDRPSRRNVLLVAWCTALAFLFRHDHGVYIGAAALAAFIARHWTSNRRLLLEHGALYAVGAATPLIPFLMFLQVNGGISAYFREGWAFSLGERDRSMADLPPRLTIDRSAPLFALAAPPPLFGQINVRWAPGVTEEQRVTLEQRYKLTDARFLADDPRGRSWAYTVLDTSPANLRKLSRDPHVEDTLYRVAPKASLFDLLQQASPLFRIRVAPGLIRPENAPCWLYALYLALPAVTLAVLRFGRRPLASAGAVLPNETPKMVATATLCGIAAPLLLRAPLAARFADVAGPTAVLGAWLLGRWLPAQARSTLGRAHGGGAPRPPRGSFNMLLNARLLGSLVRGTLALVLLGLTFASIATVAEDGAWLANRIDPKGPGPTLDLAARRITRLTVSPPLEEWAPPGSTGLRAVVRYIAACTEPTDRMLVTWFAPELYYYAGRGYPSRAQLLTQRVPIILSDTDDYSRLISRYGEQLATLLQHYRVALESAAEEGRQYRVLLDTRLEPTGQYLPLGLPCFAPPA